MHKIRLSGAKFELLDCHRHPIMCVRTDCNGEAFIERLPYGTYYLRETEAPNGYEKSHELVEVCIDENGCHRCVEVINKRRTGSIKLIKYGVDC